MPRRATDAYPFELSGGSVPAVVFAIALACGPRLLIADEPTTGLDITTQKAVMDLVRRPDAGSWQCHRSSSHTTSAQPRSIATVWRS